MPESRFAVCIAGAALGALAACSGSKSKPEEPMKLADFKPTLQVERAWQSGVSGAEPKLRLGLGVSAGAERVFLAGANGAVQAVQLRNGARVWERHLDLALTGGPGAGEQLVVVGGKEGELVALSEADGTELWRVALSSEVLSAPAVGGGLVAVRTADGKLYGLNSRDGERRWVVDQTLPSLTLRGTAPPVISGELVIAGFDNGRLLAVNPGNGNVLWDVPVSQARGTTALQRMVDLDSAVVPAGDDVYVVGFQGKVARLSRADGTAIWTRDLSSYRGLTVEGEAVYVATAAGEVVKLDRRSGVEQWRQKGLLRRQLSAPAVISGHVVVADLDGVVHWLSSEDGSFRARSNAGSRVDAPPVVSGELLLVESADGKLQAFRVRPSKAAG